MTKVSQGLPKGAESAGRSKKIEICIPLLSSDEDEDEDGTRRKMMKTMLTLIVSQSFDQHVF